MTDDVRIVRPVAIFADIGRPGPAGHSTVIAEDVKGELRGPDNDSDYIDIVTPADLGALGSELMLSVHPADLISFVHDLEQRSPHAGAIEQDRKAVRSAPGAPDESADETVTLRKAQDWAAWFAAAAEDARQRSEHHSDQARQAHERIDTMIVQGVEAGLGLKSLSVEPGEMALSVTSEGVAEATVLVMLDGLADMLGDATNYVEFELQRRGKTPVSVCVRRMHHPTPHQLRETAEHQRDTARAEAAELRARLAALTNEEQPASVHAREGS